jgi:probable F420-dependent oxidoreductase
MKFGVFLPTGEGLSHKRIARITLAAEGAGLHGVWIGDHVVVPAMFESNYPYGSSGQSLGNWSFPEVLATLSYLAGKTETIRLGTCVLVAPMRNPVWTAKILATIDYLSGGRLIAGVGVGWLKEEYKALGASFTRRWEILDEWLAIYRHLWAVTDTAWMGKLYQFDRVLFDPKPAQRHIPIIIGGNGKMALRRAARHDGWMPYRQEPEQIIAGLKYIDSYAASSKALMVAAGVIIRLAADPDAGPAWRIVGPPEHIEEMVGRYATAGVTELVISHESDGIEQLFSVLARMLRSAGDANITDQR